MPQTPPRKTPFLERREREFLYLHEVDALITALEKTRSPIRNQALALLLFCQALQPVELCWLRWCDISFVEKTLLVTRNRQKTTRYKGKQITVNLLLLCPPEIDLLQQLYPERTTDWVFALLAKTTPLRTLATSYNPKQRVRSQIFLSQSTRIC